MQDRFLLGYRRHAAKGTGARLRYPLVLLRGLGRSSGFWLDFKDRLAEGGAEILTLDLLGTGLSRHPSGRLTMTEFAGDVLHTLANAGVTSCHLVGISLGGMVALRAGGLARAGAKESNRPSNQPGGASPFVSFSILASSSRGFGLARIRPRALASLAWAVACDPVPKNRALARFLVAERTLSAQPDLPDVWDRLWQEEGFARRAVLRQLFAAACYDARADLAALGAPSLFMVSRDDKLVPWRNTLKMWERAQDAELKVLDGLGHDFPTDDPQTVASMLIDFCRRVESKERRPEERVSS